VGASGSMLVRVMRLVNKLREQYSLDNAIHCVPPGGTTQGQSWAESALATCTYLEDRLKSDPPKVVVPMGGVALRRMLGFPVRGGDYSLDDFHGTYTWDPTRNLWIVPTFHPAHLLRGATNLMGVVAYDLNQADAALAPGFTLDPETLVCDPPLDWLRAWVKVYLDAVAQDPLAYPLAVDIETPDKQANEGALIGTEKDASYVINRINLSYHPEEGITIPAEPEYLRCISEMLWAWGVKYYWFKGYDEPRLLKAGLLDPALGARQRNWDLMWMWKALQSDLPAGLGFATPFYCKVEPWKHLSKTAPVAYAAKDGVRTRRTGDGIVENLISQGRWSVFERHMSRWHATTLAPATEVGLAIDRDRLTAFKGKLDTEASKLLHAMQVHVPEGVRALTPKLGLTRPPAEGAVHTKGRDTKRDGTKKKDAPDALKMGVYAASTIVEKLVMREVQVCRACGKLEVAKSHRCEDKQLTPDILTDVASVTRWFWQEPFNPDSPKQMMAYVLAKGDKPGKSKSTGNDSVDRETLTKLFNAKRDPFYALNLDYRAVNKVRGTYVEGTFKRLDLDDRVHPETTFKPSTMRTSQVNPNIQNVVADKSGKDSLAAGFRDCVVARGMWVEAGSGWEDEDVVAE